MTLFQIALILVAILTIIVLYLWGTYNGFIRIRNQVKTDYADIDVQLKRRASLIANLVELVREYAKHEKSTFENFTKARAQLETSTNPKDLAKSDNMLTSALRSLFAVTERYPNLQASSNYKQVQQDLKETENLIASYREEYNRSVLSYNTGIQIFPNLLVANLFGFTEEELFQPDSSTRGEVHVKAA